LEGVELTACEGREYCAVLPDHGCRCENGWEVSRLSNAPQAVQGRRLGVFCAASGAVPSTDIEEGFRLLERGGYMFLDLRYAARALGNPELRTEGACQHSTQPIASSAAWWPTVSSPRILRGSDAYSK
jgi:hypothetical protein